MKSADENMRVLHVIPSLSVRHGGPSHVMPLMARSLVATGVTVDIATTDDDGPGARAVVPLGRRVERDGYGVFYFPKQTEFYKVSLPLGRWLKRHAADYDLVHVHALFSYPSVAAARAARAAGVPCVIRPLGVLNRYGMENRRRSLKRLSFQFIEGPALRQAAAAHYTSNQERTEAEAAGATAPAAVIPLGIDLAAFAKLPDAERFFARWPQSRNRQIILFLSRVDPKKGLDLLLPAFAAMRARFPQSLLVIAGEGGADYLNALRQQAVRLGISEDVLWTGFLGGEDKLAAFSAATVFTLPSYSENFGIALVEALAAGLPCVTAAGVAVADEIRAADAGAVVPGEVPALATALERVLADPALRARWGANARRLAAERFSLAAMGGALKDLYQRILTGRQPA